MTGRDRRFSFLQFLGDGLLLFCILTGTLFSFLSLYTHPDFASLPSPRALRLFLNAHGTKELLLFLFCLTLLITLIWSLPRFRGLVLLLYAGVWTALAWPCREIIRLGGMLTLETVADLFEFRVGWFGPVNFELMLTNARQLAAAEHFLFFFVTLLAFYLGWAVVRTRRWWLAALLTLPLLLPGLLADVYPNWVFFLMLTAGWCTMLLTGLSRTAPPPARGRLTLLTLPAAGLLLALLMALFPAEGYQRPDWTCTAEEELTNFANRHFSFLNGQSGPLGGTVTYVGSADSVDLSTAGPLHYTGRTVLHVTSHDYTGRVYLRGTALARYTGVSWEPTEDEAYRVFSSQSDLSPLLFPALVSAGEETNTLTVTNTGASGSCVYAPYQLARQDWAAAGLLPVKDSYLARESGRWTHTVSFCSPDLTGSASPDPDLVRALEHYGQFISETCTEKGVLPPSLVEEFLAFADHWEAPGGYDSTTPASSSGIISSEEGFIILPAVSTVYQNPVLAAQMAADFLADRCVYDQNTPLTPEGEDFAVYFLTESRQGYCMHFASAAVLLLRELGHPARYVSGFTAELTAGSTTYVPDSAAHAWAEVYVDGFGWYPVEVTPAAEAESEPEEPVPAESEPPEESEPLPSEPAAPSDPPEDSPSPSPEVSLPVNSQLPLDPGPLRFLAVLIKGLLAAGTGLLLLWLVQHILKKQRAARLSDSDTNRAVLAGYRYLSRMTRWGWEMEPDVLELAQKARFSQHRLTGEERQTVLDCYDGTRARIFSSLSPLMRPLFRYFWGVPSQSKEDAP